MAGAAGERSQVPGFELVSVPALLARPTGDRKRCTRTTTRRRRSQPPWSPCRRIGDKPVRPQPWPAGLLSGGRHERAPVFLQDDGWFEF